MKTYLTTILLAFSVSTFATAEPIKLNFECTVTGTKITGEKTSKQFKEKFILEKTESLIKNKDGKVENWGVSKTDFISDGTKYDVSTVAITPEHVVTSFSNVIGVGYNRKLLVFTHIIDIQALEMERIVIGVPIGSLDERTHAVCKKIHE